MKLAAEQLKGRMNRFGLQFLSQQKCACFLKST